MEKRHKEILVRQRANLVENLNMRDGLYTQLITRKVLNQRMVRSIQNGRTLDQQAEELLNVLEQRGRNAFKLFCDALRDDFQEEIVELYLESEFSDTKDDDRTSVQETSSVQGSEDSQSSLSETLREAENGKVSKCLPEETGVLGSAANGTEIPKPVVVTGISVCEEFQQQTYRRSIEPSLPLPRTSQDSVDSCHSGLPRTFDQIALIRSESDVQRRQLEQEARSFYENSILNHENPSGRVFTVLNGQRVINPVSPFRSFEKDSVEKLASPVNPIVERDSPLKSGAHFPLYEHSLNKDSVTAQKIPSFHSSSSSSPLFSSSYQDSIEKLHYSPHKFPPNSKPFVFETVVRDLNGAKHSDMFYKTKELSDHIGANEFERNLPGYQAGISPVVESFRANKQVAERGDLDRNVIPSRSYLNQENEIYRQLNPSVSSVQESKSKYSSSERDFKEIPRYKEREVLNSGEREMFSLPRHVERVCSERSEELQEKGNYSVQRLARNDSVDTMNKRPFTEIQEINTPSKRFCPVPELTKPEKLTTLQVYDNVDKQVISIPVIDEPYRRPAPPVVVIKTPDHTTKEQKLPIVGVMDDPEIDLTDGPVNVRVEVSSKQFYLANYKQAYPMRRIPRGKALILNVNEVVGKAERRGTDIDRDNLQHLLCQLHFDVTVYNDNDGLTAKEMVLKLQDFSQHPGHEDAECAVICILSHGEEGYIFGADGKKFELDAVFSLFDNTCCKHLMGKPKIFIIQACRGGALDKGVSYSIDEHDGSDAKLRQVPSMSDMLICYPTQMGYYAWRNRDRGSWYVEALVQVFMKYAKSEDLCTMLNRVNLLVSKKVSHCPQIEMDQMCQMSEYKSTLRMPHLYFFPGIAGDLYR